MTIKATIIADSISLKGIRLTTFEFEYPRFIHSEVMTHRMLSKNCASSRAIPIKAMHESIRSNPGVPIYWGKNQAGMKAKEQLTGDDLHAAQSYWKLAQAEALDAAMQMDRVGLHKQIANRVTEPFQVMKTVITGTEWENFFWLRNHPDAQPEFQQLAAVAKKALNSSTPQLLNAGEWHLPYIKYAYSKPDAAIIYLDANGEAITLEDAKIISASCCAQVSYRKSDDSLAKAKMIFGLLIDTTPVHASPVEHQATPIPDTPSFTRWPAGVTHMRADRSLWSGNFREWIQFRQLIPNHCVW
jgi:hypothetical protein